MTILLQDPVSWTSIGKPNQWAATLRKFHGHNGELFSHVPISTRRLQVVAACVSHNTCS
jgi:hypothetical protein